MEAYEADGKMFARVDDYLDPLFYWAQKAHVYPNLFQVAIKALAVPATSVLSEQVFS